MSSSNNWVPLILNTSLALSIAVAIVIVFFNWKSGGLRKSPFRILAVPLFLLVAASAYELLTPAPLNVQIDCQAKSPYAPTAISCKYSGTGIDPETIAWSVAPRDLHFSGNNIKFDVLDPGDFHVEISARGRLLGKYSVATDARLVKVEARPPPIEKQQSIQWQVQSPLGAKIETREIRPDSGFVIRSAVVNISSASNGNYSIPTCGPELVVIAAHVYGQARITFPFGLHNEIGQLDLKITVNEVEKRDGEPAAVSCL